MVAFSTGILAATVIAASDSVTSFFVNAVETFKLAFWIGLQSECYALSVNGGKPSSSSWSLVIVGSSREEIIAAVSVFNDSNVSRVLSLLCFRGLILD